MVPGPFARHIVGGVDGAVEVEVPVHGHGCESKRGGKVPRYFFGVPTFEFAEKDAVHVLDADQ